jgi:hypothetical protein
MFFQCSQSQLYEMRDVLYDPRLSPTQLSSIFFFSGEAADVPYGTVRQ